MIRYDFILKQALLHILSLKNPEPFAFLHDLLSNQALQIKVEKPIHGNHL
jgi:hypothetical protein